MRVSGQIEEVSLEQLATDPDNTPEGRFWENISAKEIKAVLNGVVRKIFTTEDQIPTANIADNAITTQKIADNAVTTQKIPDSGVTTIKIANGAVTQAKRAALGQQISASSGSFITSNSASYVDVTNMNVTITTTGRPVFIGFISDGTLFGQAIATNSGSAKGAEATIKILRGASDVSILPIGVAAMGNSTLLRLTIPVTSIYHIDTPAAGTYTYKLMATVNIETDFSFKNAKMVAFEL